MPRPPSAPRRERGELFGPGFTLFADILLVGLSALLAWSVPMLIPLLPGPLAFAATVVDLRSAPPSRS
ncbi:hypothetical protein [Nonomuraea fuscirosea]|uniref:hypothetical protein n=1 Tax=Nonomuraea fuscirosea TaxID=1291556 RepID=UPI00342BC033